MIRLPADDREPSPRTGCTRVHGEAAADALPAAVAPYATPDRALYRVTGGPAVHRSAGAEPYGA
ncbi:hypothetical protein [Streptomyces sp. CoH27]|uniref:hypothetical protein n=1 Tax=Streptomyces sp. CoH27 TaxID=2875763 RepID=UPI001CD35F43|nr:hypothetical protein [Streptomyces sp. CoH27]